MWKHQTLQPRLMSGKEWLELMEVSSRTHPQGHSDLSKLQVPPTCVCKHHRFLKSCPASIQQGAFSSLLCVNISAGSGAFFRHPCWNDLWHAVIRGVIKPLNNFVHFVPFVGEKIKLSSSALIRSQ